VCHFSLCIMRREPRGREAENPSDPLKPPADDDHEKA